MVTADDIDDHRAALNQIPAARLRALEEKADAPGVIHFSLHVAVLIILGTAILTLPGPWWALALVGYAIALIFLFAPLHETVHETAFRTVWLNRQVGALCGFILVLPALSFRYFHLAHHRHTQDAEKDPELGTPKPETLGAYLFALTGWHYWRGQAVTVVNTAFGKDLPDYVPPRAVARVRREARLHLAGYAVLAGLSLVSGSTVLLWLWVVPLLVGQPFLRAYLLAEHPACPLVPDMLRNSRTTFTNRLIRWLAWEMPNHTAHHAAPNIPFFRLRELTDLLDGALKSTADGYVDAHRQIVANLGGRPKGA